ncbi:MAG TPA: NADH-quinone oxidoreductase subunit L [Anaerolineae bacterium]
MVVWLLLLTISLPWLGALAVWLAGDRRPQVQHALAIVSAGAAGLASVSLLPFATSETVLSVDLGQTFGAFTFVPDGLGVFLAAIATVIGSLAIIFSVAYMRGEAQLGRYYALVLLFIGAMAGLVLSGSLLLLFIFWEITAFCSYALISFHGDDPRAVAGGVKALIITQFGGIGLLLGTLAAQAYLGDYQIRTLLSQAPTLPPAVLSFIAFAFLLAAVAKSAQVPLHTWLPDAMEAPTPVSALIHAATMVNAGVYLLARFYPIFAAVPGWRLAVITIGLLSALLAALMALVAFDLKRVLAYSTISQLGVMVYAVGIGAIFASQLHLLSHAVFKALLFLAAGAITHAVGSRDMRQMGGLRQSMPFVAVVFALGSAALAGLPLLNGFWSKELILEVGLANGPGWAYAGMLAGTGLTALYTVRMVWLIFYANSHSHREHHIPMPMRIALAPLALGTLVTWLVAGGFSASLAATLPFHHFHVTATAAIVREVGRSASTWIAVMVALLGLVAWWQRRRLAWLAHLLRGVGDAATRDFGFEWLNRRLVILGQGTAAALQSTQTGQLNWNVVGIVAGLLVVLVILVIS